MPGEGGGGKAGSVEVVREDAGTSDKEETFPYTGTHTMNTELFFKFLKPRSCHPLPFPSSQLPHLRARRAVESREEPARVTSRPDGEARAVAIAMTSTGCVSD